MAESWFPEVPGLAPKTAERISRLAAELPDLAPAAQAAGRARLLELAGELDSGLCRRVCALCLDALISLFQAREPGPESPLAEFFALPDHFPLPPAAWPPDLSPELFDRLQLLWLLVELRDWPNSDALAASFGAEVSPDEPRLWLLLQHSQAGLLQHRQDWRGYLGLWLELVCELARAGGPRCGLYCCLRWISQLNWGRDAAQKKALLQKLRRQLTRGTNFFSAQLLYQLFTLEDRLMSPAQKMECARRLLAHPPALLNSRQLQHANFLAGNYSTGRKNSFAEAIQYFKQSNYHHHKNWTRLREQNRYLRERLAPEAYRGAMAALELEVLELGSQVSLQNDAFVETLSADYDQIRALLKQVEQLSLTDSLTGLRNHRYLAHNLAQMLRFAARHAVPVCLASFDIDSFKAINDTHGHPAGDLVLRELAGLLQQFFRASDIVIRSGGDEFVAVIFGAAPERALALVNSFLARVSGHHFGPQALRLTLSIGLCCAVGPSGLEAALASADRAMYAAKAAGGNRVACLPPPGNFPLDT